jgi:hypothetical protein
VAGTHRSRVDTEDKKVGAVKPVVARAALIAGALQLALGASTLTQAYFSVRDLSEFAETAETTRRAIWDGALWWGVPNLVGGLVLVLVGLLIAWRLPKPRPKLGVIRVTLSTVVLLVTVVIGSQALARVVTSAVAAWG